MVSIDAHEVFELAADIERNAAMVPAKARLVTSKWGHDVQAAAQVNAPVVTGTLMGSISTDITDDGLGFEVGPTAEYGGYVEEGTAPHPIPDAFGWGITVMHPGTSPEPYLAPAFDANMDSGLAAFGELASQILGGGA